MEKITADDPIAQSADIVSDNISQLAELFPEAITEGKIDFDVLKQLLGGAVDERDERYGLNWHGKRRARQLALTPSLGTLRPCPEESVDWDTTQNLMIEGDNLEVLKLLQKSYSGKVKLIYIDPPYNTGHDFVYPDNFRDGIQNYLALTGQRDLDAKTTTNSESSGRFHTQWLNMIYPRLKAAKNLLREDGVICISIDDVEQASLKHLCADIFGEENYVATIVWQKRYVSNVTAKWLSDMHDFVLVYAKDRDKVATNDWDRTAEQLKAYKNPDNDPRGVWRAQDLSASKPYSAGMFDIIGPKGETFSPPPNRYWRCNRQQFDNWRDDNRIWWGVSNDARPMLKAFLEESQNGVKPHTWWDHKFAGHNKEATLELKKLFDGDSPFDTPKPVKLTTRLLELFCSGDQIVMDFFAGSGPLAQSAMQFGSEKEKSLRYIAIQIPEPADRKDYMTIAEICKERLRRVGRSIRSELKGSSSDLGFRVFKLDASNIETWDPNRDDLDASLEDHVDHVKEDRSDNDVLYELLLKLGLDLCVPIEQRTVAELAKSFGGARKDAEGPKDLASSATLTVHSIGAGVLFACLDKAITSDDVEPLAHGIVDWHNELAPAGDSTVVFRDSAFGTEDKDRDVVKTNLSAILQQHGLKNVRSL